MAKIIRKIDFLYNNFPKKERHKKKIAFGEKKSPKIFRACGAIPLGPPRVL